MEISINNPLDKARELGNAISQSKEYLALRKAEADFHNDKEASDLLKTINDKKQKLNLIKHEEAEGSNVVMLENEITILNDEIQKNIVIQSLFEAQEHYNNLIRNVNNIIDFITGNEKKGCSNNSCGSCNCSKL